MSLTVVVLAAVSVLAGLAIADALRSGQRSSTPLAASGTITSPSQPPVPEAPGPTAKQEIERIGNSWAPLFAAENAQSCRYMTQPVCERIACERVGGVKIRNCTPPTAAFRKSFEAATLEETAIRGHRAAARFSNGEVVEFYGDAGTWHIKKVGGNAGRGFFD